MVHKAPSKKKQKGGIDFKKIRRKIGRKLPPPNNATNTEIKSKAIILPEQSVASDKTGLAVNKKGLTLKELLQQTSHHNYKVRKDALLGVKDLISNHPSELRSHKYAIVEKLRERISDSDKMVREGVYQLFLTVIFPKSKEDSQSILVSSMMTHIFCAMTHLEIDIRLMAFRFLDLVIHNYPLCFLTYAKELNISRRGVLHAFESQPRTDSPGFTQVLGELKNLVPTLVNCLHELSPSAQFNEPLDARTFDSMLYLLQSIDKAVRFIIYGKRKIQNDMDHPMCNDNEIFASSNDEILSVLSKKVFGIFPLSRSNYQSGKDDDRCFVLNVAITEIFLLIDLRSQVSRDLLTRFVDFIEQALHVGNERGSRANKKFLEKHLVLLVTSIPKLLSQVDTIWKKRLLEAFSTIFRGCHHESAIKLACLYAIEEMIVPRSGESCMFTSDPTIIDYHMMWIRELPLLTLQFGDQDLSAFRVLMSLQLLIGQRSLMNPLITDEYSHLQYSLIDFFGRFSDGVAHYGPFTRMPLELQEYSISCLYYFTVIDSCLLESLVASCLCPHLNSSIILRIVEVIHSAYKAGHVKLADYVSFFISLLSCYQVSTVSISQAKETDSRKSNNEDFRLLTNVICSGLTQLGDPSLVLEILESVTIDQMSGGKLSNDNTCALLRVLMTLDSRPTNLSEVSIAKLNELIPGYMVDVTRKSHEDADDKIQYYFTPCFLLFHKSPETCGSVLKSMGSMIIANGHKRPAAGIVSITDAVVSVISMINRHDKFHQILWSFKAEIDLMVHNIFIVQSSVSLSASMEDRHKMQSAADRLKFIRNHIP